MGETIEDDQTASRTPSKTRLKNWNPHMAALMQEVGALIKWHGEFDQRSDANEVREKIKRWLRSALGEEGT